MCVMCPAAVKLMRVFEATERNWSSKNKGIILCLQNTHALGCAAGYLSGCATVSAATGLGQALSLPRGGFQHKSC
jgi:hypothetical protein